MNGIVRQPAVGSAHEIPVKRDHVHHVPEAEHLLGEAPCHAELRPHVRRGEKQLRRIIAGLAVDLDAGREVGCLRIVQPVVVREPGVGRRHGDQLARAGVIEAGRLLALVVQHLGHAVEPLELGAHRADVGGIAHVHVRHLVIGDGKRARHPRVEQLAGNRVLHDQQARAS